jgi:hypothetical protein
MLKLRSDVTEQVKKHCELILLRKTPIIPQVLN